MTYDLSFNLKTLANDKSPDLKDLKIEKKIKVVDDREESSGKELEPIKDFQIQIDNGRVRILNLDYVVSNDSSYVRLKLNLANHELKIGIRIEIQGIANINSILSKNSPKDIDDEAKIRFLAKILACEKEIDLILKSPPDTGTGPDDTPGDIPLADDKKPKWIIAILVLMVFVLIVFLVFQFMSEKCSNDTIREYLLDDISVTSLAEKPTRGKINIELNTHFNSNTIDETRPSYIRLTDINSHKSRLLPLKDELNLELSYGVWSLKAGILDKNECLCSNELPFDLKLYKHDGKIEQTKTNIKFTEGDVLSIHASGKIYYDPVSNRGDYFGPYYHTKYRIGEAGIWRWIHPEFIDGATINTPIISRIKARNSGVLYIKVLDPVYHDNSGYFNIAIGRYGSLN